ncbi:MAG: hypothetical protein V1247_08685, partial [Acidimicrobiales bacterium]|nr:hypothetical protein [Acidimicrobiales bacterium]
MKRQRRLSPSILVMLGALAFAGVACGGGDAEEPAAPATTAAPTAVAAGPLRVAIVAPSASDDLAFSQSMVDSVNALERDVEL